MLNLFRFQYEPITGGALIAAGISAASAGGQIYAAGKMNRKTRQWNEMMYGRQRADALADWQMQNAYNSPQAQMARYKEAGLNPMLIYGQQNEGATVRSASAPSWNPETPNIRGLGSAAIEGIAAYQDFSLQQEQVKNMVAARKNMELDASLKVLESISKDIGNKTDAVSLSQKLKLYDTAIQTSEENLRALRTGTDIKVSQEVRDAAMHAPNLEAALKRIANISEDTRQKKQQIELMKKSGILSDLEIGMRRLGMTYNDNLILRMLGQFMEGRTLPQVIGDVTKALSRTGEMGPEGVANHIDQKLIDQIRKLRTR